VTTLDAPLPLAEDTPTGSPADRAKIITRSVVTPAAAAVDHDARFPSEAMSALADARLLSAGLPVALGGEDAGIRAVADAVRVVAHGCSSTAMVYAMHQIQVWCLLRHGHTPELQEVLGRVGGEQLLLASATSEVNVGGDVRTSLCAVETAGGRYRLEKQAPVISYGQHAGAVLATARRTPDSPASDQVLVCCQAPGLDLEPTGEWDTLGFRGTCSRGFVLRAEGPAGLVFPDSYSDVSSQTMLPVSHIVWASVWLGIAEAAAATAHRFVRTQARQKPGSTAASGVRLAELAARLQDFRGLVGEAVSRFEALSDDRDQLGDLSFAVAMNGVKISSSTLVVDLVSRALLICGMAGYREDSPFSLGRLLRDAYGAALMVNNDRVLQNTAQLLLASKEI
jgi:acyl-CoA dehydrogenase